MNFARYFVDRPIFAGVLSILITLIGALAFFRLPVTQYPEVVPPHRRRQRQLLGSRCQNARRNRSHSARAGNQRRGKHAVCVVVVDG